MIRRLVPIATVVLALGASACSSSTSSSSTSTTGGAAKTTTTAKATTTTKASTTTTSAGPARCTASTLSVTAGLSSGSAGHVNTPVVFTNTSSAPCTIFGYPGIAALDASGSQAAQATRASTPAPTHLIVAPGSTASAIVIATNVPSGNETTCPTWAGLLVTPPNDTKSSKIAIDLPGCNGFTVGAVVAGSKGL